MIIEFLAAVFQGLGSTRRRRQAFELRAFPAPRSSAAHRDDFSHCWGLLNTDVPRGATEVTFTWRRGPDGKPGEPVQLGPVPLMQFAPLDGITRPSQRPAVSAEVSWTESDGSRRTLPLHLD